MIIGRAYEPFDDLLPHIKSADPKFFVWNVGGYVWIHNPDGYRGGYYAERFIQTVKNGAIAIPDCYWLIAELAI